MFEVVDEKNGETEVLATYRSVDAAIKDACDRIDGGHIMVRDAKTGVIYFDDRQS